MFKKTAFLIASLLAAPAWSQVALPRGGGGGGGTTTIVSGTTPITGGADTQVCFNDAAVMSCGDAGFTYVKGTDTATLLGGVTVGSTTTAGTGTIIIDSLIGGASATDNLINLTATLPASLSAETDGVLIDITTVNQSQAKSAFKASLSGTGANTEAAIWGTNGATATTAIGVRGDVTGAATNSIGVRGVSSAGTKRIGGAFGLAATNAPSSAGLFIDNSSVAAPILVSVDNTATPATTGAYAGMQQNDGGQLQLGLQVLTSATMTPTIVGEARTVTHSYAWTNAMVVALGAVAAGDITVSTLPAKTQINNAYVVIDTAATQATTLTVSCGDAIAGTPFINYIVASDAKAAANTVYGDAVAERGTSIDTEFYYLPAYAATTLVTCHFIAGTTLNTVTASTGRLILTTTLLP